MSTTSPLTVIFFAPLCSWAMERLSGTAPSIASIPRETIHLFIEGVLSATARGRTAGPRPVYWEVLLAGRRALPFLAATALAGKVLCRLAARARRAGQAVRGR